MADTDNLDDDQILAMTAWGEARGDGNVGMHAILNVIMNRANHPRWWGNDPRGVCLMPLQFDCWMLGDPNRAKMLALNDQDTQYAIALDMADLALDGGLEDITDGATSYYALSMINPPKWAIGRHPVKIIGKQAFFVDE